MFSPRICSSGVNQTQATELAPDLVVATVNMDIDIFLSSHSTRNFSVMICHLLNSRNFFLFGPTVQEEETQCTISCFPHFSSGIFLSCLILLVWCHFPANSFSRSNHLKRTKISHLVISQKHFNSYEILQNPKDLPL